MNEGHSHDETPEPPKREAAKPDENERTVAVQIEDGKIILAVFPMTADPSNGMVQPPTGDPVVTLNLDHHAAIRVAGAIRAAAYILEGIDRAAKVADKSPMHADTLDRLQQKALETKLIPRRINRHHVSGQPTGPRYGVIREDLG